MNDMSQIQKDKHHTVSLIRGFQNTLHFTKVHEYNAWTVDLGDIRVPRSMCINEYTVILIV